MSTPNELHDDFPDPHTVEPPVWNIKVFREAVSTRCDPYVAQLAFSSAHSLMQRADHITFHNDEARRITKEAFGGATELWQLKSLVRATPESSISKALTEASAHVIASVQALHSISDLFAHAIFIGLNMKSSNLTEENATFNRISRAIKDEELKTHLNSLSAADGYKYLNALCNHGKHRRTIPGLHTMRMFDPGGFALRFGALNHNDSKFPECAVFPYLEDELKRQFMICRAGYRINDLLAS